MKRVYKLKKKERKYGTGWVGGELKNRHEELISDIQGKELI